MALDSCSPGLCIPWKWRLQAIYPHGEFNHQSAFQYLESSNAVEELQKNLCAEMCNFLQFQVVLWKNCLNPLQAAIGAHLRKP